LPPESLVEAIRAAGYDAVLPRTRGLRHTSDGRTPTRISGTQGLGHARSPALLAMVLAMPLDSDMGSLDHGLMRVLALALRAAAGLLRWSLLVVTALHAGWAGRGIYLRAPSRPAARHHQHEHAGEPGHQRRLRVVSVCHESGRSPAGQVYFDAVLLIVGFLLLGKSA
jgi:Cu+-exporting ATPase